VRTHSDTWWSSTGTFCVEEENQNEKINGQSTQRQTPSCGFAVQCSKTNATLSWINSETSCAFAGYYQFLLRGCMNLAPCSHWWCANFLSNWLCKTCVFISLPLYFTEEQEMRKSHNLKHKIFAHLSTCLFRELKFDLYSWGGVDGMYTKWGLVMAKAGICEARFA